MGKRETVKKNCEKVGVRGRTWCDERLTKRERERESRESKEEREKHREREVDVERGK